MPHFSASGHDIVLCQVCGRDVDTGQEKITWRPDITGSSSAGNVCEGCEKKWEGGTEGLLVQSLYDHCKQESGETEHHKIMAYLNRHYGHN